MVVVTGIQIAGGLGMFFGAGRAFGMLGRLPAYAIVLMVCGTIIVAAGILQIVHMAKSPLADC